MTFSLLAIVIGLLVCVPAGATPQTESDLPSFEAASVKPAAPDAHLRSMRGGPGSSDPGRIDYTDVTLDLLIVRAFRVRANEIVGPDWMQFPVYVVTAAKVLPKLQATQGIGNSSCRIVPKADSQKDVTSETRVECRNMTMAGLASRMPLYAKVNMRFVDASHIDGTYDFDLTWTPAAPESGLGAKSMLASEGALFDALEKQVGLKVEN